MSAYEVACVALLDTAGGGFVTHGAQQVVGDRGVGPGWRILLATSKGAF